MGGKIRTFIALNLPEEALEYLEALTLELEKKCYPLRYYTRNHFHLTLKFLGELEPEHLDTIESLVKTSVTTKSSITLKFATLGGSYPPRPGSALWIETTGDLDTLEKLKNQIDKNFKKFGFKPDSRFTSHITIGRFKKVSSGEIKNSLQNLKDLKIGSLEFMVKSLGLFKSTLTPKGPIYEKLRKFDF